MDKANSESKIKSNRKKILMIAGVFFFLVAGTLLTINLLDVGQENSKNKGLPCADQQSSDFVRRASTAQNPESPEKLSDLRQIREEVLAHSDYEKDVYCLHIVTSSYVYFGDYENSRKYLDMLNDQLRSDGMDELTPKADYFMSVENLRKAVDSLRTQVERLDETRMGIPRKQPDGTILDE